MSDMKQTIAEACVKLLVSSNKLTVTDIVEAAGITRQTFYYHFEDIPDLFRWMLEKWKDGIKRRYDLSDPKKALKYLILMGYQARPYIEETLKTNYRDELIKIFDDYIRSLFIDAMKGRKLYEDKSMFEVDIICRYHTGGLLALIRSLDADDIRNIDKIVDTIHNELH